MFVMCFVYMNDCLEVLIVAVLVISPNHLLINIRYTCNLIVLITPFKCYGLYIVWMVKPRENLLTYHVVYQVNTPSTTCYIKWTPRSTTRYIRWTPPSTTRYIRWPPLLPRVTSGENPFYHALHQVNTRFYHALHQVNTPSITCYIRWTPLLPRVTSGEHPFYHALHQVNTPLANYILNIIKMFV